MNARLPSALVVAAAAALLVAASAGAHAHVLPETALADEPQLFTLAVSNEKDDEGTTKVVLTVPDGFQIGQFVATDGWKREQTVSGSGEDAHVESVTWTAE